MYEQIVSFLEMVDEEERATTNPLADRKGYFLKRINLRDWDGFRVYRLGQLFSNALRGSEYYHKLTQSPYDCFFSNEKHKVEEAIDFLCRKGPWEK